MDLYPSDVNVIAGLAERELARTGWRLQFRDKALENLYRDDVRRTSRVLNRFTLMLIILVVDAFFLTEFRAAPELFRLSAWLRFGLLTPACVLFVMLDWRDRLGRYYDAALTMLAILPTLVVAVLITRTTSAAALPNLQATPLIQLVVMTSRLDLRQATIVNSVSCLAYLIAIAVCPIVGANFLPSMVLASVSISIGALAFATRVDLRERQVFLLGLQAEQRRALLAQQNAVLARLTHVDALTGLGNRRCFDETLQAAWDAARAKGTPLGLILLDIDHFKAFNDTLGHQAGDECLRSVGQIMAQTMRNGSDTATRYGGEEFAIILPGADLTQACAVAERMNQAVWACHIAHPASGAFGRLTVSLGVASTRPDSGQSPVQLIGMADACLYAAKHRGRNQVASDTLAQGAPAPGPQPVETG